MKITPNQINNITRKKAPRYLYHFTTEGNLNKIKHTKTIKANYDGSLELSEGVFMVDLQNFIKNWSKFNIHEDISLLTCLLGQTSKHKTKIACLKIPTSKLENDIIIRSQNSLFKRFDDNLNRANSVNEIFSKVEKYKLYQRNGHSIEYMHKGDIPFEYAEVVSIKKMPKKLKQFFDDFWKIGKSEISGTEANKLSLEFLKNIFTNKAESKVFK